MTALPDDLATALDEQVRRHPVADLSRAVARLSERYRENRPAREPIMRTDLDVAAYAGYRMPATYAAVERALGEVAAQAPDLAPTSLVDVGGGTGTVLWAACATWPSITSATVLEQAGPVAALGRTLAARSDAAAVRGATWRQALIDPGAPPPAADLVTASYVLGELPDDLRTAAVGWLAAAATTVVLVEPGTPAGYERIVAARTDLRDLGFSLVAPCPHDGPCPIPSGSDWCHFSVRLPRAGLHRAIKDTTLSYEDEKFAYVAATRAPVGARAARVLRHPQKRKGLVGLRLCTTDGALDDVVVSKRQGARYRAARDVEWGDAWEQHVPS